MNFEVQGDTMSAGVGGRLCQRGVKSLSAARVLLFWPLCPLVSGFFERFHRFSCCEAWSSASPKCEHFLGGQGKKNNNVRLEVLLVEIAV